MSVFIKFIVCLLIACEKLFSLFRAQNYLLLISCTNLKAKQQSKKKKNAKKGKLATSRHCTCRKVGINRSHNSINPHISMQP